MFKKLVSKFVKCEFTSGEAKLKVKNQRLELIYANRLISSDICIHTSVLIDGQWVSSTEGLWSIEKKKDSLHTTIDWKKIPVRHLWQIKRKDPCTTTCYWYSPIQNHIV